MNKKRTISLIAGIALLLGMSTIAFGDETTNATAENGESVVVEEAGAWTVDEYVDDFGDGIGIKYAKSIAEGTFSNSATNGSDLTVITFFDPEIEEFSFRLLEYNKSKANYYNGDLLRILFKFDDEIEEHLLQGSPTSGDLCLSVYKEFEEAQALTDSLSNDPDPEKAYSKASLDLALLAVSLAHSPEKSSGYYQLYNSLADGNDARCVIYIDSSKYSFTIPAEGFSDAISVLYEDKYKEAEQLLSEKKYDEAIEAFENLNGYSDSAEKILEVEYEKAESLLNDGEYEEAKELFISLEDYANSAEMVEKCIDLINNEKYEIALDYLKNNRVDDAIREFTALKDYKDSEEKLKEGKYQKALDKMNRKEYSGAKKIFESIGDYSDASDKAEECESLDKEAKNEIKYKKAEKALESEDYDTALKLYSELEDYKESKDRVQECLENKYQEAIEKYENGQYEEAQNIFDSLGDYSEAKNKSQECHDKLVEESEMETNQAVKIYDTVYSMPQRWLVETDVTSNENMKQTFIYTEQQKVDYAEDIISITLLKNVLRGRTDYSASEEYLETFMPYAIQNIFPNSDDQENVYTTKYNKNETAGKFIKGINSDTNQNIFSYIFFNSFTDVVIIQYYHSLSSQNDYKTYVKAMVDSMKFSYNGFKK